LNKKGNDTAASYSNAKATPEIFRIFFTISFRSSKLIPKKNAAPANVRINVMPLQNGFNTS